MSELLTPGDEAGLADAVRQAGGSGTRLSIVGGGTRSGLGRPRLDGAVELSMRGLSGITLFEPSELVVSARAGTPLRDVDAVLAAKNLMLPFEPMDHRTLYGTTGEPTIGAVAACNVSGPRRLSAGAARDHLIGIRLVNGRGEIVKAGGRVMKNVTGLDLVKLCCGAHGTLGVLTEVTFKLLPRPERQASLVFSGLSASRAVALMSAAMRMPFDVAAAAHLPAGLAAPAAMTLLRLEGFEESVAYRMGRLSSGLAAFGDCEMVEPELAAALWTKIRDAAFLSGPEHGIVLRVHVAPARAASFIATVEGAGLRYFSDWAGGLIWLGLPEGGGVGRWRMAAERERGHLAIIRAPDTTRVTEPVFQPLSDGVMRLTEGVKSAFDPQRLINTGRMYPGI